MNDQPDGNRADHCTHSNQNAALAETETQQWAGPGSPADASAEQPQYIDRYKVIGILGRGGFGTVYRARDEELQRDVAIKVWPSTTTTSGSTRAKSRAIRPTWPRSKSTAKPIGWTDERTCGRWA